MFFYGTSFCVAQERTGYVSFLDRLSIPLDLLALTCSWIACALSIELSSPLAFSALFWKKLFYCPPRHHEACSCDMV